MNPLYLTGYGVKIRVSNIETQSELEVIDGRERRDQGSAYAFQPRRIPFDSIIVDGHSGYISFQALHWLSRNNVPVFVMNYDGRLISSTLPPMPMKADLRAAQFKAADNLKKKISIAHALLEAKFQRSLQVLDWLGKAYDIERQVRATRREAVKLGSARTIMRLQAVEARVAFRYWQAYREALPKKLGFHGRMTNTDNRNASNPVNLALNYGYGFLEGECRRAVNIVGLEAGVGFLHSTADYQTKQSLVYDLQEPFRWLVDLTVMKAFESGNLKASDFFFTEHDYRLGFDMAAKGRFLTALREQFNSGALYKGRVLKWDTVIQQKTNELAKYLSGRSSTVDFSEPSPILERLDTRTVRETILTMTQAEAKQLGIGKSTLHYLRRNVRDRRSFRIYSNVKEKMAVESSSSG